MTDPTTSPRDSRDPFPEELEAAERAESLRAAWPRLADLPDHSARIIGGLLASIGAAAEAGDWRKVAARMAGDLAPATGEARAERLAADFRAALADGERDGEALRIAKQLAAEAAGPVLTPAPFGEPLPEPVISRDGRGVGTVLCRGEVAILTGPGGGGKSTVALALSHAARAGGTGRACGLRIVTGRVAFASYEDSPPRLAGRMGWYGPASEWRHVRIAPTPTPLWTADPEDRHASGPSAWWAEWWRAVSAWNARLVVIDPASVAFAGANPSDGAAVRAFLAAVQVEAERIGAGVLILAHDTKGGRRAALEGSGPGAAAVAGSAQWIDGSRAVLHLSGPGPDERRLLVCEKSNYGPTGWGARLAPRWEGDKWRGLRCDPSGQSRLNRERVADTRREWAGKPRRAPKAGNGVAPDGGPGL